jgi:hypothetical protein
MPGNHPVSSEGSKEWQSNGAWRSLVIPFFIGMLLIIVASLKYFQIAPLIGLITKRLERGSCLDRRLLKFVGYWQANCVFF